MFSLPFIVSLENILNNKYINNHTLEDLDFSKLI